MPKQVSEFAEAVVKAVHDLGSQHPDDNYAVSLEEVMNFLDQNNHILNLCYNQGRVESVLNLRTVTGHLLKEGKRWVFNPLRFRSTEKLAWPEGVKTQPIAEG